MKPDLYVVTGATGHVGSGIAEALLAAKKKVRVVGRSAEKLKPLAAKGAEVFVGDLEKTADVAKAFAGAGAVFAMIPPHYQSDDFRAYQNRVANAIEQAIRTANVPYVVTLSSIGAQHGDKVGLINGLHDFEEKLNQIESLAVVHLRPAYFMENHFSSLGLIKHSGMNGGALRPELTMAMIATADIAKTASDLLLTLNFSGKSVRELLGPRDVTMLEVTRTLGQAIGKPDLKYVQFSYEDMEKALLGMSISKDVARLFVEMIKGMNEGLTKPTQGRQASTTTPTTFEEFVKILAQAYQHQN